MQKIEYPLLPHQKILLLRVQQGLSVRDLSRLSGVHHLKIHRIEFGSSELRLDAARRIIHALDTSPEELASSQWDEVPSHCWSNCVSSRCLYLRKERNVKLKILSRAASISMASLCRLESGELPNPTFVLVQKLSDYYKVAISWLMSYNN